MAQEVKPVPTVTLVDCNVLDVEIRPYKNKAGENVTFRNVLFKYQGKVFELGCEKELSTEDLMASDGRTCDLVCALTTFGDKKSPEFRVKEIA